MLNFTRFFLACTCAQGLARQILAPVNRPIRGGLDKIRNILFTIEQKVFPTAVCRDIKDFQTTENCRLGNFYSINKL